MSHKRGIHSLRRFHANGVAPLGTPLLLPALVLYSLLLLVVLQPVFAFVLAQQPAAVATSYELSPQDRAFVEDLSRRSFRFFWENADPDTGLVRDRARTDGYHSNASHRDFATMDSTGFGLTDYFIVHD